MPITEEYQNSNLIYTEYLNRDETLFLIICNNSQ